MMTSTATAQARALPLCVDLDGTLVKGDTLVECLVAMARSKPLLLFIVPYWLLRGRGYLKSQLAMAASLAADRLPYRKEVLEYLRAERQTGRKIILVTAADQRVAEAVAGHLALFDEYYGSDHDRNLKGSIKAARLVSLFGEKGFDYAGDSGSDYAVWKQAKNAVVVGSQAMADRAATCAPVAKHFPTSRPSILTFLRSVRIHHWSKNALVFLPVVLSHTSQGIKWQMAALGFLLFGMCASGLYVLNDLLDLHSDRTHPWKSSRPFASGELPLWFGAVGSVTLIAGTLAISFVVHPYFAGVLTGYAALTILYSWKIKRWVLADVFVLASFYGIRIVAGAVITATPLSQWFLAFAGFLFLSLAMAKRNSELLHAKEQVLNGDSGRAYTIEDRELLAVFGIASAFCSVVILALYAHSPEVMALYGRPTALLWLCPIILYWLSRMWLFAHRGTLEEDPVSFALRDRTSLVLGLVSLLILVGASLRWA
jgi:4-hydroxybenzoate polyprenyltransferase/phosphoserine phosphatase